MDESEIKNVVNKMVKKYKDGGKERGSDTLPQRKSVPASAVGAPKVRGEIKEYRFVNDTIPEDHSFNKWGAKPLVQQYFVPWGTPEGYEELDVYPSLSIGRTEFNYPDGRHERYFTQADYLDYAGPMGFAENQDAAKLR
jgi:hypothetical protein